MPDLRALLPLLAAAAVLWVALACVIDVVLRRGWALVRRSDTEWVTRRCDHCGRAWKADPQRRSAVVGLRLRRRVRRRAARQGRAAPAWSGPTGWRRCPSCLSSRVRTSGDPVTPRPWSRSEWAGAVLGAAGVALLVAGLAAFAL